MNNFTREDRYIVIKRSDLDSMKLTDKEKREFEHILYAIKRHREIVLGKAPLQCVVVENDWPEYEPTWRAIETRMTRDIILPYEMLYQSGGHNGA